MTSKNLAMANVVIIANTFNVSIFSQLWFVKHEIFTENELASGESIFFPVVTQIGTSDCHLLIVPERLQLTLKSPETNSIPLSKVNKIVNLLPETPYVALGMNVSWELIFNENVDVGVFTRENFVVPNHRLSDHFSSEDARFGAYLSKDFDVFRLKLDIKPVISKDLTGNVEKVHLTFNFHLDLSSYEDKAQIIKNNLIKWDNIFSETENIVRIFNGNE
jgi:hypothetical protein